jgi:carbon-monoxide dehydrogenase iron sulfur subunit
MKIVYPVEERCIDCHLCEVACIVEHSESKNPVDAYFSEGLSFNSIRSSYTHEPNQAMADKRPMPLNRCLVEFGNSVSLSTNCRHCENASCVLACKNGSLYYDHEGRVLLNEKKCVGCWMCLMACEYGAISRNANLKNVPSLENNGIQHHCDLCPEREEPACVMVCPTNALAFEDR